MAIDFDSPRTKAISAARLASVTDLFHHRAALFFTPTANIPKHFIGQGSLDVSIYWPLPNWTTYINNRAYQIPRFWVDAIQQSTRKLRWQPNFPAKVVLYAYYDISSMDMAIGGKALLDALKVSTTGRRDGKLLHYFGAIEDDSPNHIDFEAVVDLKDKSRSGTTRITVEPITAFRTDKHSSWRCIQ